MFDEYFASYHGPVDQPSSIRFLVHHTQLFENSLVHVGEEVGPLRFIRPNGIQIGLNDALIVVSSPNVRPEVEGVGDVMAVAGIRTDMTDDRDEAKGGWEETAVFVLAQKGRVDRFGRKAV